MTEVYLITGFLGAGKTCFVKNMVKALPHEIMDIIVNEFGREGIDGALLHKTGLQVKEIVNGSIFCTCRLDQFEEALASSLSRKPEAILVEASGLSDPMNIRRVLDSVDGSGKLHYAGAWCLVDALNFPKVYQTAVAVKKQLAVSDVFIVNKTDLASEAVLQKTLGILKEARPECPVYTTSFGQVQPRWILPVEIPEAERGGRGIYQMDITNKSYLLEIKDSFTKQEFEAFLDRFIRDTYRVKGFVRLEGRLYLADCTSDRRQLLPWEMLPGEKEPEGINRVVILGGSGLPTAGSVKKACLGFEDKIISFQ